MYMFSVNTNLCIECTQCKLFARAYTSQCIDVWVCICIGYACVYGNVRRRQSPPLLVRYNVLMLLHSTMIARSWFHLMHTLQSVSHHRWQHSTVLLQMHIPCTDLVCLILWLLLTLSLQLLHLERFRSIRRTVARSMYTVYMLIDQLLLVLSTIL